MWISFVFGMSKVYSLSQELLSASLKLVPEAEQIIGVAAAVVDELGAPEAGHSERHRMIVGDRALAHQ